MIVSFTGHRPQHLPPNCAGPIRERLKEVLLELKPVRAFSGMAIGVDTWGAQACLETGVPFIACVPFDSQDKKWSAPDQKIYRDLLTKAEKVHNVSPGPYQLNKLQLRNEFLVDACDLLIAVMLPKTVAGGTYNCVKFAELVGKPICHINPLDTIRVRPF